MGRYSPERCNFPDLEDKASLDEERIDTNSQSSTIEEEQINKPAKTYIPGTESIIQLNTDISKLGTGT